MALLAIAPDAQAGKPPPPPNQYAPNYTVYFVHPLSPDPDVDAWNRDATGPVQGFSCNCPYPPCTPSPFSLQVENRFIHSDMNKNDYPLRFDGPGVANVLGGDRCGYLSIITEPSIQTTLFHFTYWVGGDDVWRHLAGSGTLTQSGRREPGWFTFQPSGTFELTNLAHELVWRGPVTFIIQGCEIGASSCRYGWW